MTLIRIISGVALLSYVILLWLVRRDVRRRETRAFVSFLVAMLVWQAGITGVTWTSDPQTAEAFYRIVLGLGSSFSIFYAQFVREYLRIERHRWLMRLGFSWAIGAGVYILAGGPGVIQSVYPDPNTGLLLPELGPVPYVYGMIIYLFLFYSAFHLIAAHRQERSAILRNRIKYLLTGLSLVFAGSLVNLSDSLKGYPVDMVGNALNAALIAYAILRLKLFDISWVIRKGLVYSGLTLAITIVYFLVVSLAINILHVVTDYQIFLLTLFMAALTAVAILPLRDRVQGWVDRRFFREKHDWSEMLQRLSRTVASVLDLRKVTEMILNDVLQTMHIGSGAFLIRQDEDGAYRVQTYKGDAPVPQSLSLFRADSPVISWLSRYQTSLSSRASTRIPTSSVCGLGNARTSGGSRPNSLCLCWCADSLSAFSCWGPNCRRHPTLPKSSRFWIPWPTRPPSPSKTPACSRQPSQSKNALPPSWNRLLRASSCWTATSGSPG